MNKKLKFIFKDKKNYKIILYLFLFIVIFFSIYFFIPKFYNYTPKLVQESLKKNSNISIKHISNINYNLLPSPRLKMTGVNLEFGDNVLNIDNTEIDIILNPLSIINYKTLDYNKFLIKKGTTVIEINKIEELFYYIKKNKYKINFKDNNIILLSENKKLLEINDSLVKFVSKNNNQQLIINGFFLNHKASFILKDKSKDKINIALKIPELDISTDILIEDLDNLNAFKGIINFEVLNNFFQFNFTKKKNMIINKGFIRSNLINSAFEGSISFKPYFTFNLDIQPSSIDMQKFILLIKQKYFSDNLSAVEMIKKIDGSLNFKNKPKGIIVFKNREISIQNFEIGKEKNIYFNAKISELGKKGKIQFNLINNIKKINIFGYIIPSSTKVKFEKIIFGKKILTEVKVKNYEKKFNNEIILNTLSNIFDEIKINNFFKIF